MAARGRLPRLDWTSPGVQLHALLAVAIVFGGGGVGAGLMNLVVQLAALLLLAVNRQAALDFVRHGPRALVWLVALTFALPVLHGLPLPPALWQALPGRELVSESLALVGREQAWFPLSVDPARSWLAALALIPPFAVMVLAYRLGPADRAAAMRLLVWLAIAGLALGAVQVLSDNRFGHFHPVPRGTILFGTFANRNAEGLFLAMALTLLLFTAGSLRERRKQAITFALAALLALGVLLTQSRSGTILLIAAGGVWAIDWLRSGGGAWLGAGGKRRGLALVAAGIALAGVAGIAASSNDRLRATFERFAETEQNRPEIWGDALASAQRFWPVGSGMGTFDEVFQIDESLEYLMAARAGRAHNDYLELAVEAGIAGLALAAAWLIWLVRSGWRLRAPGGDAPAKAALVCLALIAAQALVDYPLRNEALLCLAAFLVIVCALVPNR